MNLEKQFHLIWTKDEKEVKMRIILPGNSGNQQISSVLLITDGKMQENRTPEERGLSILLY